MCLYAPDVSVGPDGRYYLFYVLDKISIVSVAVCDTPAGKYEFLGYVQYPDGIRLGEKAGDEPQFDPGVITVGDKTYLYTGFCGHGDRSRSGAMVTVLDKDMLTVLEGPRIIVPGGCYSDGTPFEGHGFFETPSYIVCNMFTEKESVYVGDNNNPKVTQEGRDGDENSGYIAQIASGTTLGFKYFACKNVKAFSSKARGYVSGSFEVKTSIDGSVLANIPVAYSTVWETYTATCPIPDGVNALYLTYQGDGTAQLASFRFIHA